MKEVTDFTFLIGPPGQDEMRLKLDEWSKNSGNPATEIWVEYVHEILSQFSQRTPENPSSNLDEIFSRILGLPVLIDDPFMTYTFQGGGRIPGMMIYIDKVRASNGKPLTVDWANPEIRESVGSILGMVLKSEWVKTLVAYR